MKISIIIRIYNEEKHLGELLQCIFDQDCTGIEYEILIVDSGSTDRSLEIASSFCVQVICIQKDQFSFGRSLNIGCAAASGDILVFISGHCIPVSQTWLRELIAPFNDCIVYVYGSQRGNEFSKFSECQLFAKYYPGQSSLPQEGFYCNNANAALLKNIWEQYKFDEELTGLEDMYLAQQLVEQGYQIGYTYEAPVYHLHNESWVQVKRRFERESIALQHIMPEVHVSLIDFLRYFISAILLDIRSIYKQNKWPRRINEIFMYRLMQFWGTYRGNHFHRQISKKRKDIYFYPR